MGFYEEINTVPLQLSSMATKCLQYLNKEHIHRTEKDPKIELLGKEICAKSYRYHII